MDIKISVVTSWDNDDDLCRACFAKLKSRKDAGINTSVNILEMPGLLYKLSACISLTFIETKVASKYLCRVCFESVNEFYKFREMCLQSLRRFEANEVSKNAITYSEESIQSEGRTYHLLPNETVIKKEFEVQGVSDPPQIFAEPSATQKSQLKKESIESEGATNILLSSESVVKEEYELNDQPLTSNRETTSIILPEVVNDPPQRNSIQNITQMMSVDGLETVVSVKNEPICSEGEEELSSDNSRNTTPSPNVHKEETTCSMSKTYDDFNRSFHCTHECCDKSATLPENLRRHQHTHTNPNSEYVRKRYHCTHEGCDKSYASPALLKVHQSRHETPNSEYDLTRYHCTQEGCNKSFAWPMALRRHQKRHELVYTKRVNKRFHCTYDGCDRSYAWAESAISHRRTHDLKRYYCTHEGCDKSFLWPHSVKKHQRIHDAPKSDGKRYRCPYKGCYKSYGCPERLEEHDQSQHKNQKLE